MLIYVADLFAHQYEGGAELTTEAIIDASLYPGNKVNSQQLTIKVLEEYKNAFWVFGNYASLSDECIQIKASLYHYFYIMQKLYGGCHINRKINIMKCFLF